MDLKTNSFPPHLTPLLCQLLKQNIGTLEGNGELRICDLSTGRPCIEYFTGPSINNNDIVDRFKIKIPFAGRCLVWDIIFNSLSPEDPPDFNLNDNGFMRIVDADCLEKFVPSLLNWRYDNPYALKNVVAELVVLYRKYQLDLLKDGNCWFEYVSIVKAGRIKEGDIEVFVADSNLVHFYVRLCLDLTDYAVPRTNEVAEQYAAYIKVCFNTIAGCEMLKPQVTFSPLLSKCLSRVPVVGSEGVMLSQYIANLNEKLEESLSTAFLKPVNKRKKFIFEWQIHVGAKVIEFDALEFRSISFLLDQDSFCYILSIELPLNFTSSPPLYKLRSVYSCTAFSVPLNVPYDQSWMFKVMVTKALSCIESKLPVFKQMCVDNM